MLLVWVFACWVCFIDFVVLGWIASVWFTFTVRFICLGVVVMLVLLVGIWGVRVYYLLWLLFLHLWYYFAFAFFDCCIVDLLDWCGYWFIWFEMVWFVLLFDWLCACDLVLFACVEDWIYVCFMSCFCIGLLGFSVEWCLSVYLMIICLYDCLLFGFAYWFVCLCWCFSVRWDEFC